jgi:hypothetical protein
MSLLLQNIEQQYANEQYSAIRIEFEKMNHDKALPACLFKELEYAESGSYKALRDERFLPIRFLWFFEIHEYIFFRCPVLGRSFYNPKLLHERWMQCYEDKEYRVEAEEAGVLFDMQNKAISLTRGWVLIGDSFISDLETILDYYDLGLDVYGL